MSNNLELTKTQKINKAKKAGKQRALAYSKRIDELIKFMSRRYEESLRIEANGDIGISLSQIESMHDVTTHSYLVNKLNKYLTQSNIENEKNTAETVVITDNNNKQMSFNFDYTINVSGNEENRDVINFLKKYADNVADNIPADWDWFDRAVLDKICSIYLHYRAGFTLTMIYRLLVADNNIRIKKTDNKLYDAIERSVIKMMQFHIAAVNQLAMAKIDAKLAPVFEEFQILTRLPKNERSDADNKRIYALKNEIDKARKSAIYTNSAFLNVKVIAGKTAGNLVDIFLFKEMPFVLYNAILTGQVINNSVELVEVLSFDKTIEIIKIIEYLKININRIKLTQKQSIKRHNNVILFDTFFNELDLLEKDLDTDSADEIKKRAERNKKAKQKIYKLVEDILNAWSNQKIKNRKVKEQKMLSTPFIAGWKYEKKGRVITKIVIDLPENNVEDDSHGDDN